MIRETIIVRVYQPIGIIECSLMVWETGVQSHVEPYQKLEKWYLMPHFLILSNIRYRSRVSGAIWIKELRPLLHYGVVAIGKGAFGSPPTMVGQQL